MIHEKRCKVNAEKRTRKKEVLAGDGADYCD